MKRGFIVHGWDGYPEEGWFPWLKKELEERSFSAQGGPASGWEVHVPQLPDAGTPRIYNWVPALANAVSTPDTQTYFVGHSMGCQTIARYLETLPEGVQVGGAVFVDGFFKRLTIEQDPETQEIGKHWLETPLDLKKVKSHLPKSIAIFSDDDPFVPLDNKDDFKTQLASKIIIEHQMNHFSGSRGIAEFPSALKAVFEVAGV